MTTAANGAPALAAVTKPTTSNKGHTKRLNSLEAWLPGAEIRFMASFAAPQSANPRNNSLMLVLERVLASTCLTITAQYNECDPSLAGN